MHADGSTFDPNTSELNKKIVKRFTYALTRGSLQDGPGANAIWNITNVTRKDRPCLYTTAPWAKAMSENKDVIAAIKKDPTSPYYADGTDEGIKEAVANLLDPNTNQFDNQWKTSSLSRAWTISMPSWYGIVDLQYLVPAT